MEIRRAVIQQAADKVAETFTRCDHTNEDVIRLANSCAGAFEQTGVINGDAWLGAAGFPAVGNEEETVDAETLAADVAEIDPPAPEPDPLGLEAAIDAELAAEEARATGGASQATLGDPEE